MFRYSSVIDEQPTMEPPYYQAVTSSSTSRMVNPEPEYFTARTTYRSSSQNRLTSPPPRFPTRRAVDLQALDNGSASSLRLDNYVTLRKRRPDFIYSPSPSPMVLSPSSTLTRAFPLSSQASGMMTDPAAGAHASSSREGSLTPRFSHSCSNASIVSELAEN